MPATAALFPFGKTDLGVDLQFYSPDITRAQRLSAKLRNVATVHWTDSLTALATIPLSPQAGTKLVLLDYSPDTMADSSELARRLLSNGSALPLVGVGSIGSDHTAGLLAALRAGVRDFLDLDTTDEEIRHLLTRVQNEAIPSPATCPVAAPAMGRMVLLLGVRPGIGTSTLAAHLGVMAMPPVIPVAAEENRSTVERQVLLLDLGRPAGDASLYLGVESEFHYDDALRSAQRIDPTLIHTALGHHPSRLTLLSQKSETWEPPRDDAELGVLIDRLRGHFNVLLCDLGGLPVSQIPLPLLKTADEIWLIADQGIGSVVSLDASLRELERRGVRDQRLSLVVNRHDEACGVSAVQLAGRFRLPLLAVLPERSHVLRSGANQGQLLHQTSPRDPYVRALNPLLSRLHVRASSVTELSGWKRLFMRMGGFQWKNK